ncbi:MAG: hypothetical protein ACPG8V_01685 [Alphaproteobacteria bacterium]
MKYLIIKNNIVENVVMGEVDGGIKATGNLEFANIGDEIKNGAVVKPVIKLDYKQQRQLEYKSMSEQLDMIYWDKVNGTDKWEKHIKSVKDKYPKT